MPLDEVTPKLAAFRPTPPYPLHVPVQHVQHTDSPIELACIVAGAEVRPHLGEPVPVILEVVTQSQPICFHSLPLSSILRMSFLISAS